MISIILEKEHLEAFVQLLEDVYAKDDPYKYALAGKIREAIEESEDDNAEVTFEDYELEQAAELAEDITDTEYDKCPGAEHVAIALLAYGKGIKQNDDNIIEIEIMSTETQILQNICKAYMIANPNADTSDFVSAELIDTVLEKHDVWTDVSLHIHILVCGGLMHILGGKLREPNIQPNKRSIIKGLNDKVNDIIVMNRDKYAMYCNTSEVDKIQIITA